MTNHDKNTANLQSLPYCSSIVRLLFVYCSSIVRLGPPFFHNILNVLEQEKRQPEAANVSTQYKSNV